ncbi:MAG TPA: hypothetical protein VHT29_08375 [Solirubrobacteraceae bacterium]|nr:hypothetical protein [Solirubrobacteraceae bacterium]
MSGAPTGGPHGAPAQRALSLSLDGFAWEAVEQESARMGVSVEELVSYAVLYYLADHDSGRLARRIVPSSQRDSPLPPDAG